MIHRTHAHRHILKSAPTKWERMLMRLEPGVRKAVEAALLSMRGQIDLDALASAIEQGNVTRVRAMLDNLPAAVEWEPVGAALRITYAEGASAGFAVLPAKGSQALRDMFRVTNPYAVRAAEEQSAKLITAITEETRTIVRDVIGRAFREQLQPRTTAKTLRDVVGLNARQAVALDRYRVGLVEDGLNPARIETLVDRYSATLLRQRTKMIARTESARASMDGQKALWNEAIQLGQLPATVQRIWIASADACEICANLAGAVTGINEPFPDEGGDGPPDPHPQCRCSVGLVEMKPNEE